MKDMETQGRILDCAAARELILRSHVDGLGESESLELHTHLSTCPACRRLSARLEKTVSGLRALGRTDFGPRARVRQAVLAGVRGRRVSRRTSAVIRPAPSRRLIRPVSARVSVRRRRSVAWARLVAGAVAAAAALLVAVWAFPGLRFWGPGPAVRHQPEQERAYVGLIRGEGRAVLVRRGTAEPAAENSLILPGDRLELGEGVQLAVFYRDSSAAGKRTVVRVNQSTTVTVLGTSGEKALVLDRGDVYVSVWTRPGSSFTVNPGRADQVVVTGTAFEVSKSEKGTTVSVDHGTVQVGLGAAVRPVPASFSCAVSSDGRLGEPERMSAGEIAAWRVNSAPTAESMELATDQDRPLQLALRASDPEQDRLTFQVTSLPGHGSLSGEAPELTYAPEPGFSGEDTFAFKASDGRTESAEVTVRLTVRALPVPPVASIMATPISGAAPLVVRLDASGSRCAAPPAAYAWSFGDGQTAAGPAEVTHTYSRPGDYVVELTVTDALARSHSTTTTVRVSSPAGAARPPDPGGKTEPPAGTGSATAAKPAPDPKDEGDEGKPDKPGKPDDPGKPDKPDKPDRGKKPPKPVPPKPKPPKDKD